MIKFIACFRFIINFLLQSRLFNNQKMLSFIKKIYSFFFTRKGIKNVKKYIVEIDKNIRSILIEYDGYIGCGNCLFLARNQQDFGKNDIDYCIQKLDNDKIDEFIKKMNNKGFKCFNILYHNQEPIELKFKYKKTYFDVFILKIINKKYVMSKTILLNNNFPIINKKNKSIYLSNCCVVVQKWAIAKQYIEREMFNHKFLIPKNYNEYLTLQYGKDWKIPRKNFNFLKEPLNNLPILYNNEGVIKYV